MKKFIVIFALASVFAIDANGADKGRKQQTTKDTVLGKNPNRHHEVVAYNLAGTVTIVSPNEIVTLAPFGDPIIDTNIFIVGYDDSGNILFYSQIGGKGRDLYCEMAGRSLSGSDRSPEDTTFYVTGFFSDTAYFEGTSLVSRGGTDAFIACYGKHGGFMWVESSGGAGDDWGKRLFAHGDKVTLTALYAAATENDSVYFGTTPVTVKKAGCNNFNPDYARFTGTLLIDSVKPAVQH